MIPLQLTLKNFLSYGAAYQTIDFSSYSLICLAGKNGHGKSAILDAITWVLWGSARKINGAVKADEGLVRLGSHSMTVRLDFIANAVQYRVKRECTLSGTKSTTALEFGMIDQSGALIALTDKTIRATQEKINKSLGLDYEGFVNSVFLRQGQSHEFSKKTPKERKDILSALLGLDNYEQLRRCALDVLKENDNHKSQLLYQHQALQAQLEHLPTLSIQKHDVYKALAEITLEEQELITQLQIITDNILALKAIEQHFAYKDALCTQLNQRSAQMQDVFNGLTAQWRGINRKKKILVYQESKEQERIKLEEILATAERNQLRHMELKDALYRCKEEMHARMLVLKNNGQTAVQELLYQQERSTTLISAHKLAINDLDKKLQEINKLLIFERLPANQFTRACKESHWDDAQNFVTRYATGFQQLNARQLLLESEQTQLMQKHSLVAREQSNCPLCTQSLTVEQSTVLTEHYAKKQMRIAHQLRRLERIIPILQKRATYYQKFLQYCMQAHDITLLITTKQQELITHEQALKALHDQIALAQKKYDESLLNDTKYLALQEHHKKLEHELTCVAYNPSAHAKTKEQYAAILQERIGLTALAQEFAQQDARKQACYAHGLELKRVKKERLDLLNDLVSYKQQLMQLPLLREQELLLLQKKKVIIHTKENLLKQQGSLEQQQQQLEKLALESEHIKVMLISLDEQILLYQAIAQALSKDGIPALIIEEALPELESEANRILSKLTDNQAQLTIDSLKNLKTGGIRETLDIKISDSMGIRPYEMFSGGEAFRIDFALRIALSKLLARRAGTSLQTLIIDEGFGSQDDDGLHHIMDALYKVQDDFAKIIVISHLPAIKEHFPVHFMVSKGPQGSTVAVIEQG